MIQEYSKYTAEDHEVWGILFDRQEEYLHGKVHPDYLTCLDELSDVLNGQRIPEFNALSAALHKQTGWSIHVVPGLIPVDEFFKLLSERKFCSSTWIRSKAMLDYLEEPDMFHDIFGHTPLLVNSDYADFMQALGSLGVKYSHSEMALDLLKSFYWFTIEFGLIANGNKNQIYGAGIISSYGETKHIYYDDIKVSAFDLEPVIGTGFINSEIQSRYFRLESLDQLYGMIDAVDEAVAEALQNPTTLSR